MVATASHKTLSLKGKKLLALIDWSLLVSLSFHGLFFLTILPKLHLNSNGMGNKDNLSSTPVIELNSIEQTRLPDLTPRNLLNWNGINPLPNLNSQFPPLPLPHTSLPNIQPNSFQFPLTNNNNASINLPPPPSIPSAPTYLQKHSPDLNLPQPDVLPPPPLDASAIADLPPRLDSDTSTEAKNLNVSREPEDNEAQIREKLFPIKPETDNQSPRDFINSQTKTIANNSNSTSSSQSPANQNSKSVESTVAIISPPVKQSPQQLSQSLQKKEENTSDEEARKNYVAWAGTDVKIGTPQEKTLQGVYPKNACIRRLEGSTTYGVTVNSQGKVTHTKLIKSSGYPLFNDQALKQIQESNFPNNSGVAQAYHVYVNFKYNPEICPSLSLPNLGKFPANSSSSAPSSVRDSSTPKNPHIPPKSSPEIKQPSRAVNETKNTTESEVKSPSTTPKNNSNNTPPVKLPAEVKNKPATKPIKPNVTPLQLNPVKPTDKTEVTIPENTNNPKPSSPSILK